MPQDERSVLQAQNVRVLGMGSNQVRAEIIEIAEYPRLAEQLGVRAVPTTIIDGRVTLTGYTEPEALVDQIVRAAEHRLTPTRGALLTSLTGEGSTPLPKPPPREERGTVRPSGLVIPDR